MRLDIFLFFASAFLSALGEWGLYIGAAGMAVSALHCALIYTPNLKVRRMVIIIGLVVSGAIFVALLVFYTKPEFFGLEAERARTQQVPDDDASYISFQKYTMYWVEAGENVYRLGILAKFFNPTNRSYLIDGIAYEGNKWTLFPRGDYLMQRYTEFVDPADRPDENNYIKANSEGYVKKLLSVRMQMIIQRGKTPDLLLRGRWHLIIAGKQIAMMPLSYFVAEQPITRQKWEALAASSVESIRTKAIPSRPPKDGAIATYLVYSADPAATFDNPYFTQAAARNAKGTMLFLSANPAARLDDGWILLGHTYREVFSNPYMLEIYNSIYPPGPDGKARPFAYIAGLEQKMLGGEPYSRAPMVTQSGDIIEFTVPGAD